MPRSIDHAINTLRCVKELGYQGQLTWALTSTGHPPTKENRDDDSINNRAAVCFEVAKYLQFWLHDEVFDVYRVKDIFELLKPPPPFERIPVETWRFTALNPTFWTNLIDGVYYVYLDAGDECHAFVVVLKGDQLIYAGGYGGIGEFKLGTFNRALWQDLFNKAVGPGWTYDEDNEQSPEPGDLESYARAFCLDKPAIAESCLQEIIVNRSPTYV